MKESKKDIVRFAIAAQLIVSIVLGFYNIFLGIGGVLIFVVLIIYYSKNTTIDEIKIDKAIDEIYSDLDKINQERMYEMPIAMAIVDNQGIIYWYNQAFGKAFKRKKKVCSRRVLLKSWILIWMKQSKRMNLPFIMQNGIMG